MKVKFLTLAALFTLTVSDADFILATPSAIAKQTTNQHSPEQVRQEAGAITVKIISKDRGGSGILIGKQGQVYSVLTNLHVLAPKTTIRIQTPDGSIHNATLVPGVNFEGKDVALLQFRSDSNYTTAKLSNLSGISIYEPVFAAGFPYNEKDMLLTTGKLKAIPRQPFKLGYQIGYSNNIEKGMSGGPILTSEGIVIGINGIHAEPLWGNPYIYEDGEQLTEIEQDFMRGNSWGIPLQSLAQLAPQYISIKTSSIQTKPFTFKSLIVENIKNTAKEITVGIEINSEGSNGSGVIIAKQDNTYYVLTSEHVVRQRQVNTRVLEVITPDGKRHQVKNKNVTKIDGVDLAILQFTSQEIYRVSTLAKPDLKKEDEIVFISGFPSRTPSQLSIASGRVESKELRGIDKKESFSTYGYELVYTNITEAGMSGGPVLDLRGHLIAIHGRAEGDIQDDSKKRRIYLGYSLGVPISNFLDLAIYKEKKIDQELFTIYNATLPKLTKEEHREINELSNLDEPDNNSDALTWLDYGDRMWRRKEYNKALTAFNKATELAPGFYPAWYAKGLTLLSQNQYQEALVAVDRAINESQEEFAFLWGTQGEILIELNRNEEAAMSFDKALALEPRESSFHIKKGLALKNLQLGQDAITAYGNAISINPSNYQAYNNRGLIYFNLRKYQQAIADYTTAISLNSSRGQVYYNRSQAYHELSMDLGTWKTTKIGEDYVEYLERSQPHSRKAIADYEKAIQLDPSLKNPLLSEKLRQSKPIKR